MRVMEQPPNFVPHQTRQGGQVRPEWWKALKMNLKQLPHLTL